MVLQERLVGHWTMDKRDASDGTIYDRSAYNNHGDINGPTATDIGIVRDSFDFDGTDDYVNCPGERLSPSNFGDSISLSAWVAIEGSDGSRRNICGVGSSSDNDVYRLGVEGTTLFFYVDAGGNTVNPFTGLLEGKWYHVAGVYDGSSATIYVYGEEKESSSISGNLASSNADFTIGARDSTEQFFDGKIDDVRVYDRALSQAETNQMFQMRSTQERSIASFHDFFESGDLSNFDNDVAVVVQDRAYRGANSAYCQYNGTNVQFSKTAPAKFREPKIISYRNQETTASTGSGMRIKNSNGNYEMGCALDNPEWDIEDGSGFSESVSSGTYDEWTRFTVYFDSESNTFDIQILGPDSNTTHFSQNRPLINGGDINEVEFWNYNSTGWGNGDIDCWFDDIQAIK